MTSCHLIKTSPLTSQFKNEVFGLDTQDGMIDLQTVPCRRLHFIGLKLVIPPSYLDALKSHPALSFKASIDNVSDIHQPLQKLVADQIGYANRIHTFRRSTGICHSRNQSQSHWITS